MSVGNHDLNNSSTFLSLKEDSGDSDISDKRDIVDAVPVIEPNDESSNTIDTPKRSIVNSRPLSKNDMTYKLEEFKKNFLMIFNHENLDGFTRRLGTDKDVKTLKDTFSKFGFEISEHTDLKLKEIDKELNVFAEKDFSDYGCLAVAILTHGTKEGLIRAKDRSYNEIRIIDCFTKHKHNQSTVTKPKILIIQACRGYVVTPGLYVKRCDTIRTDIEDETAYMAEEKYYTLPAESDILVLHSSYTGRPSYRDVVQGSWFIQALCRKIEQLSSKFDLQTIITEMKREIAIELYYWDIWSTGGNHIRKQMPVQVSTLIRKLYLRKHSDDDSLIRRADVADGSISDPINENRSIEDGDIEREQSSADTKGESPTVNQDVEEGLFPSSTIDDLMLRPQEIDPLAIVWSNTLRKLNARQRLVAEKTINDIFFKYELNNLKSL